MTAEEQLKAFQTDYQEVLSSRYGLDPAAAKAIPFGTAQEMENHAKSLQHSLPIVDALLAQKYKGPKGEAK